MSTGFRAGAMQLADEVARLHERGPGLPAAEIAARSRRSRRRHEAALVVVSGAAVAAVALAGAALLDGGAAAPPAGGPSAEPSTEVATTTPASPAPPTSTPSDSAAPPEPGGRVVGPDDVAGMVLDPVAVGEAVEGLGALTEVEAGLEWGLVAEAQVSPTEACRPAVTVVEKAPAHYEARMWTSDTGQVVQEVLLLDDADAAATAFEELRAALTACPEFGASVPGSSGAWFEVGDLTQGDGVLPSVRATLTESGEGAVNSVVEVDVLVGNAIVRARAYRFDGPTGAPPATRADAVALDDMLQEALSAS